jgi:hypothetical protein
LQSYHYTCLPVALLIVQVTLFIVSLLFGMHNLRCWKIVCFSHLDHARANCLVTCQIVVKSLL